MSLTAMVTPAFAADPVGGGSLTFASPDTKTERPGGYGDIRNPDSIISAGDAIGMNKDNIVTTNDVNNWVDRKGGELITIATRVVQVIAILSFIVSLVFIVVGALGNKRTMVGGFVALALSCVVFTAATCGPQIVTAVSSWLRS